MTPSFEISGLLKACRTTLKRGVSFLESIFEGHASDVRFHFEQAEKVLPLDKDFVCFKPV